MSDTKIDPTSFYYKVRQEIYEFEQSLAIDEALNDLKSDNKEE